MKAQSMKCPLFIFTFAVCLVGLLVWKFSSASSLESLATPPVFESAGLELSRCPKIYEVSEPDLLRVCGLLSTKIQLCAKESRSSTATVKRASDSAPMQFIDRHGNPNNFEGTFKYTVDGVTKYYSGGSGIFDTPKECMDYLCDKTVWVTYTPERIAVLAEDWP